LKRALTTGRSFRKEPSERGTLFKKSHLKRALFSKRALQKGRSLRKEPIQNGALVEKSLLERALFLRRFLRKRVPLSKRALLLHVTLKIANLSRYLMEANHSQP